MCMRREVDFGVLKRQGDRARLLRPVIPVSVINLGFGYVYWVAKVRKGESSNDHGIGRAKRVAFWAKVPKSLKGKGETNICHLSKRVFQRFEKSSDVSRPLPDRVSIDHVRSRNLGTILGVPDFRQHMG